jgi:nucleoid-associated protein YgaU
MPPAAAGSPPGVVPSAAPHVPPAGDTAPENSGVAAPPTAVAQGPAPSAVLPAIGSMGSHPLPPLGSSPAVSSPPIVIPPASQGLASGGPQVEHWDEETYFCKPGDTYESICTAYYRTDKYAKALQSFNRDHPQAGPGVKNEELQPGQAVYIPPAGVLQRRYPSLAPAPVAAVPPAGAVAPPGAAAAAPVAAGPKTYRVAPNGEMLFEIAQRTLGDGNRWMEIYRLNPKVNPNYLITGNTELQMPGDARVGP